MIPTRLYIHNFLSYRGPVEIDFRGIDIACLSGENGAGKSAMLDAITWALWGKARVNSDRDLIALREQTMEVVFEFLLNGAEYRVTRRRTLSSTSTMTLVLEVMSNGTWRSLSGDTARQTQSAIIDLLSLDYETFINSAFILQGRAGEFTTKTPQQRKQVLANILRLDAYDDYERRARAEQRQRENALRDIDGRLDEIGQQVAELPQIQADLNRHVQEIASLDDQIRVLRSEHMHAVERLAEIDRIAGQIENLADQRKTTETERSRAERDLMDVDDTIQKLDTVLSASAQIAREYEELRSLRLQESEYASVLSQREAINTRRDTILERIRERSRQIEDEIASLTAVASEREALVAKIEELTTSLTHFERLGQEGERIEQQRERHQDSLEKTRHTRTELHTTNQVLRQQMDEIKERIEQLSGDSAVCPVCEQPLDARERLRLLRQCEANGTALAGTFRRNRKTIADLDREIAETGRAIETAERRLRSIVEECRRQGRVEGQLEAASNAASELVSIREKIEQARETLESGKHFADEQTALKNADRDLAALPFDRDAYAAIGERVGKLSGADERHAELQRAESSLSSLQREREAHRRAHERARTAIGRLDEEIAGLTMRQGDRDAAAEDEATARDQLQNAESERGALVARRSALEFEMQRLADLLARRDDLQANRATLREESFDYEQLALAFGKRGLQAMIIENVAPELQDAANAILDRMPGNTMHLEFRTQRAAVSKDAVIETLDIVISDDQGQRPYEVYSGGEAFRVDFAIRVALSMLLTRRAGARLETLVIDEGFGSQDAQGRDGLLEAIRAIQPDFKMILVITHLSDLKDAFPTRIEVTKTAQGSMVTVN